MSRALAALMLLIAGVAGAHPLAPALLDLHETTAGSYDVLWRTSATRAAGVDVAPRFPANCVYAQSAPPVLEASEAVAVRGQLRCTGPLTQLRVDGLEASRINVILRLRDSSAAPIEALLDAQQPSYTVPPPGQARSVFTGYLALGIGHLLTGLDHVLFVTGLFLLVAGLRPLLLTITAFTLGHSLTLSLAVLELVHVRQPLAELGIALTILILAVELARPRGAARTRFTHWIGRWPWAMAGLFGLLHGLGFAGALADIGLPQPEIPLALFSFNLGIECGQLLLLTLLIAAAGLWRRAARGGEWLLPARALPVYLIGSLAVLWSLQRAALLLG